MKKQLFSLVITLMAIFGSQIKAQDYYLGEIRYVAFNYAPQGWALCNGQTMSIQQNAALFSLLGTTYGGNGTTNFNLPDMRGRVPVGFGQGQQGTIYNLGETGGAESVTLTTSQMPSHSHNVIGVTDEGDTNLPTNALPANTKTLDKEYSASGTKVTTMKTTMIAPAGGNLPHENRPPFTTLTCIIATQGIYPPRP